MSVPADDAISARAASVLRGEALPPPPGLVGAAMRVVRADVRPGRWVQLPTPGGAVIAEAALLGVVRRVLDELPDVSPVRARLVVSGARLSVRVSIGVRYGAVAHAVATLARAHLVARVAELLGLDLVAVDVVVQDVFTS